MNGPGFNFSSPYGIFVSTSGDMYVNSARSSRQVDRWFTNGTRTNLIMNISYDCTGLFVDNNGTLYLSCPSNHTVVKTSLNSPLSASLSIAAGNGSSGSSAELLSYPHGVFVDSALNLYVADSNNSRIQRFAPNSWTGITLLDNSGGPTTQLLYPTSLTMDADEYLYICDTYNHRIIGQGPNGFRCIIGCSGSSGTAMNQFNSPSSFSFDSDGNIYVVDQGNNRVQKFLLATNSCGKFSSVSLSTRFTARYFSCRYLL